MSDPKAIQKLREYMPEAETEQCIRTVAAEFPPGDIARWALSEKEPAVLRMALARALGLRILGSPSDGTIAVSVMAKLAESRDPGIRCSVAETLGMVAPSDQVQDVLSRLKLDLNPSVKSAAAEAQQ